MKEIYIKSDPSGEISYGKLNKENEKEFLLLLNKKKLNDSKFLECPYEFDDIFHGYGIFIDNDSEKSNILDKNNNHPILIKNKDVKLNMSDGIYCIYTSLSKCSIEFEINEVKEEEFVADKLKITYNSLDLDYFETEFYDGIYYNIVEKIEYDSIEVNKENELVDRGLDIEFIYFKIKNEKIEELYRNKKY